MAKDHGSSIKDDKQYEGLAEEGHEQAKGGFDRQRARLVEERRKEERQGTRWIEVAEASGRPRGRQEVELT